MRETFRVYASEVESLFVAECSKWAMHTEYVIAASSDYSFSQVLHRHESGDDVMFSSLALSILKSFLVAMYQSVAISLDSNAESHRVARILFEDAMEFHEMLKVNLVSIDTFHA